VKATHSQILCVTVVLMDALCIPHTPRLRSSGIIGLNFWHFSPWVLNSTAGFRPCPYKKYSIQLSKFPRAHNQLIIGSIFLFCVVSIQKNAHRTSKYPSFELPSVPGEGDREYKYVLL
jgi:hypothetical protein